MQRNTWRAPVKKHLLNLANTKNNGTKSLLALSGLYTRIHNHTFGLQEHAVARQQAHGPEAGNSIARISPGQRERLMALGDARVCLLLLLRVAFNFEQHLWRARAHSLVYLPSRTSVKKHEGRGYRWGTYREAAASILWAVVKMFPDGSGLWMTSVARPEEIIGPTNKTLFIDLDTHNTRNH